MVMQRKFSHTRYKPGIFSMLLRLALLFSHGSDHARAKVKKVLMENHFIYIIIKRSLSARLKHLISNSLFRAALLVGWLSV